MRRRLGLTDSVQTHHDVPRVAIVELHRAREGRGSDLSATDELSAGLEHGGHHGRGVALDREGKCGLYTILSLVHLDGRFAERLWVRHYCTLCAYVYVCVHAFVLELSSLLWEDCAVCIGLKVGLARNQLLQSFGWVLLETLDSIPHGRSVVSQDFALTGSVAARSLSKAYKLPLQLQLHH